MGNAGPFSLIGRGLSHCVDDSVERGDFFRKIINTERTYRYLECEVEVHRTGTPSPSMPQSEHPGVV